MHDFNYFKTVCKEKFLQIEDVSETSISLRKAAPEFSNLGGQGYHRCKFFKALSSKPIYV